MTDEETDLSAVADPKLKELIERLTTQERHVSTVRQRLHQRIEFIRSGGSGFGELIDEQLAQLEEEERVVSIQRHELHIVLDSALAEQHLRRVERTGEYLDDVPPRPFRNRHRNAVSSQRDRER